LLPLPALAAVLLLAAGCGPPPNRTTVTGPHYSFNAPGSFSSVGASQRDFPEVEDRSTLTELRDPNGSEIYATIRRPSPGTSLAEMLRDQRMVARQGLSEPIPVSIAGRPGVRIDGLRPTGADGAAIGSSSYALRDGGNTYVIGCRWSSDPGGGREACDQAVRSFEPN
jgi:hypothetical protein